MADETSIPEMDPFLKKFRLKKPSEEQMANFSAGVNAKIDSGAPKNGNGFGAFEFALGVILILGAAGVFYFRPLRFDLGQQKPAPVELEKSSAVFRKETIGMIVPARMKAKTTSGLIESSQSKSAALSAEQELAVLEALDSEFDNEGAELLEDDEIAQELNFLDEIEFSSPSTNLQGPPRI